jgi:hypothetical protein
MSETNQSPNERLYPETHSHPSIVVVIDGPGDTTHRPRRPNVPLDPPRPKPPVEPPEEKEQGPA